MKNQIKKLHQVFLVPAQTVAKLARPEHRKLVHILVGFALMLLGSYIVGFAHALGERHSFEAVLADTFGFGVHGFGAAPLIKSLADWLKIEV